MWESKKNCGSDRAFRYVMGTGDKGKKKVEPFNLCKKATATKSIKLSSSAKDRKKLFGEKLQINRRKFSNTRSGWAYNFSCGLLNYLTSLGSDPTLLKEFRRKT